MMSTEVVLFVGGGLDGELRTLEAPLRPWFKAYKFSRIEPTMKATDLMEASFQTEEYELMPLWFGEQIRNFYLLRGMTALEMFERLVEGYRKSKEK